MAMIPDKKEARALDRTLNHTRRLVSMSVCQQCQHNFQVTLA